MGTFDKTTLAIVMLGNIGLFFVDHIHFQYNGIMFGILLISISEMLKEHFLQSAFYFALLLNMKHIFVYISPVYIAYLLKHYCLNQIGVRNQCWNLIKLGAVTLSITLLSFGPFFDHIPQVRMTIIFFDNLYLFSFLKFAGA